MQMHNENIHPILEEPPLAHALHYWDREKNELSYEYNGVKIFAITFSQSLEVGFRHGSDGSLNNVPYAQQLYVMLENHTDPVFAEFRIKLNSDSFCMRPERAGAGQAIRGQVPGVLLEGINGFYDPLWDLLVSWHGVPWSWNDKGIKYDGDYLIAKGEVEIGPKPMYINLEMQYYRQHLGFKYHKPWKWMPDRKAVSGWCSWEAYRRDVSQEKLNKVLPLLEKEFLDYGLEYIQIDDGFQKMPIPPEADQSISESWVHTNDQFPEGHGEIVRSISDRDFIPAIWTNVNVTHPDFCDIQQEDIINTKEGLPLHGEWIDFLMSCEDPMLEKHVDPYYKGLREMGYRYFKTDAIRHLLMDGLHEAVRLGILTNEEAERKFRNFIEHARNNIKDSYFLASWGVMSEVIGAADGCRIAMDANPTWAGMRMQIMESARWFHTQRVLFTIDPDHLCARANQEWVRSVSSLISLSGGVYMLSDPAEAYDDERIGIIQKTLPPCDTRTAETGPFKMDFPAFTWTKLHGFAVPREEPVAAEDISADEAINMAGVYPGMDSPHPFGSLWSFSFSRPGIIWDVLYRTAVVPLDASKVRLEDCGLCNDSAYHVYDFWNQTYLGASVGEVDLPSLPLGHCQVLGFYKLNGSVQLIGTNRHVSMGYQSILSLRYGTNRLSLEFKGIPGATLSLTFHKGQRKIKAISCNDYLSDYNDDELLIINIVPETGDCGILEIEW